MKAQTDIRIKYFVTIFCFMALYLFSLVAHAGEGERKGFLIGFGPRVGYEAGTLDRAFGGFEFRIGAGLSEKFLLYYEGVTDFSHKLHKDYFANDSQIKAQYFLWKNLYGNAGLGLTVGEIDTGTALHQSKLDFVTSAALGYEFRPGKRFFVAPEVGDSYRRIESRNFHSPAFGIHLGWYF
ncbi:MAG: hypothetical protein HQM15_11940 [Deltaproteobacteria bacterium]|nr:hypothetical protein [Deltaproteobacteria bacterium]